jgi:hypothetical protein
MEDLTVEQVEAAHTGFLSEDIDAFTVRGNPEG